MDLDLDLCSLQRFQQCFSCSDPACLGASKEVPDGTINPPDAEKFHIFGDLFYDIATETSVANFGLVRDAIYKLIDDAHTSARWQTDL